VGIDLIGKPALLNAVWPGLAVEENTLQVHISALLQQRLKSLMTPNFTSSKIVLQQYRPIASFRCAAKI
jgi:DNA-binding winged helix-turn-helix (wHTH) protein